MFGKGGGALGAWLKEFLQLVFIQTIQAFIFAIAISMILHMHVEGMANEDKASVLGIMSVVCLTAIFKVEDIVKRIVGFGPTKADHGNAVKSIAKTAFAMQIGKRVLDNGKKVVGGAKNIIDSGKDKRDARKNFERRKRAYELDNGITNNGSGNNSSENASSSSETSNSANSQGNRRPTIAERRSALIAKANEAEKRARQLGLTQAGSAEHKAALADAKKYREQAALLDGLDDNSESANTSGLVANGGSSGSGKPKDYHQKMMDLEEQYKKSVKEADKKRREGIKTMTKGVMETTGAVIGATAGGILGGADGDLDGAINGIMSGAGIGDAAGELVTNTAFMPGDFARYVDGAIKDYSQSVQENVKAEAEDARSQVEDMRKDANSRMRDIDKDAENARERIRDDAEQAARSAGTNIKNKGRKKSSSGKSKSRPYQSRHGGIKPVTTNYDGIMNNSSGPIKLNGDVEAVDQ